jgi:hypothetical protein
VPHVQAAGMNENPYQSPRSAAVPNEINWGRRLAWSATIAAVAFSLLLTISYLRPFGLFTDEPPSLARSVTAGIAMLLQLTFFGSFMTSIIAGVLWVVKRLRTKATG